MSLFRTEGGNVTHAHAVPYIPMVPSRRQADAAYIHLVSKLTDEQIEELSCHIEVLRDFLQSR